jgi:hypothetical protein
MPDEPKPKQYTIPIDAAVRLRVHMETLRGQLVHFAVSLECETQERWQAVVRYDTTGGKPHRDLLRPGGGYLTHREAMDLSDDYATALQQATRDLWENYARYVSDFLEEPG